MLPSVASSDRPSPAWRARRTRSNQRTDDEDRRADRQHIEQRERNQVRDRRHHVLDTRIHARRIPALDERWAQRRERTDQGHDDRARLDPRPHRHRLYERPPSPQASARQAPLVYDFDEDALSRSTGLDRSGSSPGRCSPTTRAHRPSCRSAASGRVSGRVVSISRRLHRRCDDLAHARAGSPEPLTVTSDRQGGFTFERSRRRPVSRRRPRSPATRTGSRSDASASTDSTPDAR